MYIIPIYFFTALKQTKEPWVEVIMKKKVVVVPQRNSLWPLGERKRQEGGKLIFKATSIAKPCILPSLLGVSSIYGATSLHTTRSYQKASAFAGFTAQKPSRPSFFASPSSYVLLLSKVHHSIILTHSISSKNPGEYFSLTFFAIFWLKPFIKSQLAALTFY